MRLLLIPDATSPNGEDAFCREITKRAPARGHTASMQMVPNGPAEAAAELLASQGFANDADCVIVNSLQPAALLAAKAAGKLKPKVCVKRAKILLLKKCPSRSMGVVLTVFQQPLCEKGMLSSSNREIVSLWMARSSKGWLLLMKVP